MAELKCVLSDNQVLVYCPSREEAESLKKAIDALPVESLDNILMEYPYNKRQIEELELEVVKLKKENAKLSQKKLTPKILEKKVLGKKK